MLGRPDCPPFVAINGASYNRFEIAKVVPVEVEDVEQWIPGEDEKTKAEVRRLLTVRRKQGLPVSPAVVHNMVEKIREADYYSAKKEAKKEDF